MTPKITWTHERVGFGDITACGAGETEWAVVHACKEPCHRKIVGYEGKISREHPNYLSLERGNHLYLNLIDPPVPLFQLKSFEIFFEFAGRHLAERKILIHCNKGESRAPSLALLLMAKKLNVLPGESYESARAAFAEKFPYKPGAGIAQFLTEKWDLLG